VRRALHEQLVRDDDFFMSLAYNQAVDVVSGYNGSVTQKNKNIVYTLQDTACVWPVRCKY